MGGDGVEVSSFRSGKWSQLKSSSLTTVTGYSMTGFKVNHGGWDKKGNPSVRKWVLRQGKTKRRAQGSLVAWASGSLLVANISITQEEPGI